MDFKRFFAFAGALVFGFLFDVFGLEDEARFVRVGVESYVIDAD